MIIKRLKKVVKEPFIRIIQGMEQRENERYQKVRSAMIEMREDFMSANYGLAEIINCASDNNEVSNYWTGHTVHDDYFLSREESASYCMTRFEWYPHFREMAEMDRNHDGETLLDYGCGPGNDMVWYSEKNKLKELIGMDVSMTALQNTRFRLGLHKVLPEMVKLYCIDDKSEKIPLQDDSIDFISCQGVLMHTSNPEGILKEFYRVVKGRNQETSDVCIMVYNKNSIYYHLYAAYYLRYIDNKDLEPFDKKTIEQMDDDEVFRRSTDGVDCPRAACYTPEEFTKMCQNAGFKRIFYGGGYPNTLEPSLAKKYLSMALADDRLAEEHKAFLRKVTYDKNGYPLYENKLCCVGGVYHLWK